MQIADTNHKLITWRLVVAGAVDGASRQIMVRVCLRLNMYVLWHVHYVIILSSQMIYFVCAGVCVRCLPVCVPMPILMAGLWSTC